MEKPGISIQFKYLPIAIVLRTIADFLERNDNSSMRPGKKDTITRKKQKMRKRLLNDTMINLYHKFLSEYTDVQIAYSTFCKIKPFWVLKPNINDRDTCKCRMYENVQFKANRLHQLGIIIERDP